jgi:threonine/homoserine/homoserine lactone efflux protein
MLFALLAFSGAAFLIVLLPGPDTLVVVRSLLRHGRGNAVRTVAGVLSGLSVWVIAAALGLSAVLRASHDGYLALRIAGAAYLVWIGIQSLRARAVHAATPAEDSQDSDAADGSLPRRGSRRGVRRGVLGGGYPAGLASDLLNPKVGVFFVAFLPGFVPHGYDVGLVTILLGAIFIAETALYFVVLLTASRAVTRWLRNPRIQRRVDRATGVVLIGFGARLVLEA